MLFWSFQEISIRPQTRFLWDIYTHTHAHYIHTCICMHAYMHTHPTLITTDWVKPDEQLSLYWYHKSTHNLHEGLGSIIPHAAKHRWKGKSPFLHRPSPAKHIAWISALCTQRYSLYDTPRPCRGAQFQLYFCHIKQVRNRSWEQSQQDPPRTASRLHIQG